MFTFTKPCEGNWYQNKWVTEHVRMTFSDEYGGAAQLGINKPRFTKKLVVKRLDTYAIKLIV